MPAMRKNVSPSTLFYFPSQVRIHPQIRSQITRLQSKYSLDLDPHSGVTQPKLSRATQTFTSVKAKQYTPVCSKHPRACKPQHRHPSLSLEIPLSALSHCCHVTHLGFPVYFPPWHRTHPVKVRQATPPPRARRCAASSALWRRGGAAAAFILISFLLPRPPSPLQAPPARQELQNFPPRLRGLLESVEFYPEPLTVHQL